MKKALCLSVIAVLEVADIAYGIETTASVAELYPTTCLELLNLPTIDPNVARKMKTFLASKYNLNRDTYNIWVDQYDAYQLKQLQSYVKGFPVEAQESEAENVCILWMFEIPQSRIERADKEVRAEVARWFVDKRPVIREINRESFSSFWNTMLVGAALKHNSNIKALRMTGAGVQDVKFISEVLRTNRTLEYLDISDSRMGDEGAEAIADIFKNNITLKWLCINKINMGDKGAQAIAEALKTNETLEYLEFADNPISDAGIKMLATAEDIHYLRRRGIPRLCSEKADQKTRTKVIRWLKGETSGIEEIDLTEAHKNMELSTAIGNATLIGKVLGCNPRIIALRLIGTTAKDVMIIANEGLKNNRTLVNLDFSDNDIGNDGARIIADVLKTNETLKQLWLRRSNIMDDGARAIVDVLKSKGDYRFSLDLRDNPIEDAKVIAAIREVGGLFVKAEQLRRARDEFDTSVSRKRLRTEEIMTLSSRRPRFPLGDN